MEDGRRRGVERGSGRRGGGGAAAAAAAAGEEDDTLYVIRRACRATICSLKAQ
jgi:hypothetical protein